MADVARGHGGDGGGRDPPRGSHRVPTECESTQRKRTRGEGRNLNLQEEIKKNGDRRLPLVFYERGKSFKAVGKYHQMFIRLISNEIAEFVPFHYPTWQKVPNQFKQHVYRTLHEHFDLDSHRQASNWDNIRAAIDHDCGKRYSQRKYDLKQHFKTHGGYDDVDRAKRNPKPGYSLNAWQKTINELFLKKDYKDRCSQNDGNRAKQPYLSRHGCTSYAHKRYLEVEAGQNPSEIQGWKKMHYKEGIGFLTPEAENDWKKIEKELEKATLEAASSSEALPVNEMEVLLRALGERRGHNRGVGHKLKGVSIDYQPPPPPKEMWTKKKAERRMGKMCEKFNESLQQLRAQQFEFFRSQSSNYQPPSPIQFVDPKDFLEDEDDDSDDQE